MASRTWRLPKGRGHILLQVTCTPVTSELTKEVAIEHCISVGACYDFHVMICDMKILWVHVRGRIRPVSPECRS